MKTIKVIDLLNKIANGKEVPEKILYKGYTYEYSEYDYFNKNIGYLFDKYNITGHLNDTVIIEDTPKEDKKIEKLELLQFSDLIDMPNDEIMVVIKDNRNKINEIIKRLNGE